MDGNKMRTQKGFTLIEIMIAMVVLLVGMLGVMTMQYYAVSGNTSSREIRIATSLSQELTEQLKAVPYAELSSGVNTDPVPVTETTISGGIDFTMRWWVVADCIAVSLTDDDDTCNAGLASACSTDPDAAVAVQSSAIRVRTCWSDKDGSERSVTMDSLRWNENA